MVPESLLSFIQEKCQAPRLTSQQYRADSRDHIQCYWGGDGIR